MMFTLNKLLLTAVALTATLIPVNADLAKWMGLTRGIIAQPPQDKGYYAGTTPNIVAIWEVWTDADYFFGQ